jgi:hypothetical protein
MNTSVLDPSTLYLSPYNAPTYFEAPSYFQFIFEETAAGSLVTRAVLQ